MTETDHRKGRQNAHPAVHTFAEALEALPADFLGEGAAFSHGSGRQCAWVKFPGRQAAEEDAVGFSTHYDHRENRRMEALPARPHSCAREHTQQKAAAHWTATRLEINHIRGEKDSNVSFVSVSLQMWMKARKEWHNVYFL